MSEDIKRRTTIRTPRQPVTKESCCAVAVLVFIIEASKRDLESGWAYFFFLDALSSLRMTMHLRMRCPTPPVYLMGVLNMIEQNDCQEDRDCKKSYSSGDFKQQGSSAYNYNVILVVNCEQDWKV